MKKRTSAFASLFLAVERLTRTGNPSGEAIVQGAPVNSMGVDIYEVIRAHQARKEGTEMNAEVKSKSIP